MNFYYLYCDGQERELTSSWNSPPLHLPTVRYPGCRHERATAGAVRYEFPQSSPVRQYLAEYGSPLVVGPNDWPQIRSLVQAELGAAGIRGVEVEPGMRTGIPQLTVRWRGKTAPVFLTVSSLPVVTSTAIDALNRTGATGYAEYDANVIGEMSGKKALPEYFEVVPHTTAKLSPRANWRDGGLCPDCGCALNPTFDALIVDEESWNGEDVLFAGVRQGVLFSEKAKGALDQLDLTGVHFIPAERIAGGRDKPTLTTVLADLEFERQRAERTRARAADAGR